MADEISINESWMEEHGSEFLLCWLCEESFKTKSVSKTEKKNPDFSMQILDLYYNKSTIKSTI